MDTTIIRNFWVDRKLVLDRLGQPSFRDANWLASHLESLAERCDREIAVLVASVGAIPEGETDRLSKIVTDFDRSRLRCEYLEAQSQAYRRRAKLHQLSATTDGYRLVDNIEECRQKIEYFDTVLNTQQIPVEVLGIGVSLAEVSKVVDREQTLDEAIDIVLAGHVK